ncbi:MAG: type II toxin-antitoxin system HicB family antitoxin, partial [Chloroflexota bacterium]|nr:type II toxin-antitoxin system HicB family antitoxin [Chloroflexota bacterium]
YQVFLETSEEALEEGGYLAHVPELIGCAARGKTKEQALANTRVAIAQVLAVLRKHGAHVSAESDPIELDVTETDALTLPPDYKTLSNDELEALWERASFSRQELLDTLAEVSPAALVWRENKDSWAIRNILAHIAQADLWYASRLEKNGMRELIYRISATRALLLQQLRKVSTDKSDHVTMHDGEDWTPRKIARRMLEHEQEHLTQIREMMKKSQNDT